MSIFLFCLSLFSALLSSCSAQDQGLINFLDARDRTAPRLQSTEVLDQWTILLVFDEEISVSPKDFPYKSSVYSNRLILSLDEPLVLGHSLKIEGSVSDLSTNVLSFSTTVYAKNTNIPKILITEQTTTGTAKNPKRTELYVLTDGNLANLTLYDGVSESFESRFIFPNTEVKKGQYIVVYWTNEEIINTNTLCFFVDTDSGPAKANGVISLATDPSLGAEILDCLVYSNYEATSYSGFGQAKTLFKVNQVVNSKAWKSNQEVDNYCAVNANKATATRAMARRFPYVDTDSKNDWYITQTSGTSFGSDNLSPEFIQ